MKLGRDRGDRGAVAILVAIMAVLLVGMAAFAVDFGMAYANKTSLQKAADAAALAVAGRIIKLSAPTDDCTAVHDAYANRTAYHSSANLYTDLNATGDGIAVANNPQSRRVTDMSIDCSADGRRVEVTYPNTGSVQSIFGGLFGVSTLSASRSATADIFVATSGPGLRPYALCFGNAQQLLAQYGTSRPWVGVVYPNSSCPHDPGNWYILKCPGENAPSNAELVYNTLNGCKEEVGTIPQWDTTHTPWTPLDTATVNDSITTQCEAAASATLLNPTDCLQANPGNKMNNLTSEWRTLLTKPSITLPVFNGDWNLYAGSNAAGCSTTGSNVCYPVQALATVKVCGFWFGNGANQHAYDVGADVPGGLCPGVGADIALNPPTGPGANELWLTLVPNGYQLQGTSGPSGIALGQGFGVDGTRLIR